MQREKDDRYKQRIEQIEKRIEDLKEEAASMRAQWRTETEIIEGIRKIKREIDLVHKEADQSERASDYGKVAELRLGKIPELQKKLDAEQARLVEVQQGSGYLKEEVDEEDVAHIVAKWTGVPVSKMLQGEKEKLLSMEEGLRHRVIGQDEALTAVASAVRRSRAGLQDPNRPVGTFIFLGPTGVGKTETARALAEFLFDDERAMVRLDMSEYMEKHAVSRMIGAPPGYIGYEEGGQLTEAVRRRPYSVILFDEIEKAHPDVFNVLLQILDDGRLTDSKGRTVDFKNTVMIMTSNIGSREIQEAQGDKQLINQTVLEELRVHFKPEFLNRIDDIVIFNQLSRHQIGEIIEVQLERLRELLAQREQPILLELDDAARELLTEKGFDPMYGARPLKRAIQTLIQNPLAVKFLAGEIFPGQKITVSADGDQMIFTAESAAAAA